MTREEAINKLIYSRQVADDEYQKDWCEALDMAIKALEHPEQNVITVMPCGDAISRQAVLDAIMANNIWENEYNLTSSRIKKAVEDLPSVNPQEPKTGHWIFKDETDQACQIYTCDKCGEQISIFDETIKSPKEGHYNYCPNCGARMESEVKNDKG